MQDKTICSHFSSLFFSSTKLIAFASSIWGFCFGSLSDFLLCLWSHWLSNSLLMNAQKLICKKKTTWLIGAKQSMELSWWLRAFLSFVSFGHSTRRLSCSRTKQQLKCLRYNDFSSSLLTFWFAFVSWQPTSFEFCAFAVTSRQLRNRFHISLLSQPIDRHCEDKSS